MRQLHYLTLALPLACLLTLAACPAAADEKDAPAEGELAYYREPALHGDTLVFVAEGDLWRVPASGGTATRLTTHPDAERQPALSPDGKTIAFTARYEGPREVYTMPVGGGRPVRQTYGLTRPSIAGFTHDGQLVYSTRRYSTLPDRQLVTKDPQTGAERPDLERLPGKQVPG